VKDATTTRRNPIAIKRLLRATAGRGSPCVATVLLLALGASAVCAQETSSAAPTKATVALTPGTCAQISSGDLVTLDWNPAFDPSSAVIGVVNFRLLFKGPSNDAGRMHGIKPALVLELKPAMLLAPGPEAGAAFPRKFAALAEPNGYYHMRFQAYLASMPSGTYYLSGAEAVASTAPDYTGPAPRMTNDPTRSPFCVEIAGGRKKQSAASNGNATR
jgi:hypothetical protein